MKFTKMHGCGNDYIYFDCFEENIPDPNALSLKLSDRHFGIGGDGIVLICPSDIADGKMRMFNADGSEGNMCGNAIRCVGKYLYERRNIKKELLAIDTKSGIKYLNLTVKDGLVEYIQVDMGKAELEPKKIPVTLDGDEIVDRRVKIGENDYNITCVSMGNPHCIVFCDNVDELELEKIGPVFENNSIFPERVNTEFVQIIDENTIKMRVWERGSGETLACGTGACASVTACVKNGFCKAETPVKVILLGGELMITYTEKSVFMSGSATIVFDGNVEE